MKSTEDQKQKILFKQILHEILSRYDNSESLKEIFNYERFHETIHKILKQYYNRPGPDAGYRYVRTPLDSLKEIGLVFASKIIKEYELIERKESKLSSSQRNAIKMIINQSLKDFFNEVAIEQYNTELSNESSTNNQ